MRASGAPLTLAFIGCGAITRKHSKTLRAVDRTVRLAYASRDWAKAQRYASELGGVASFASYDAAFADERVNAVLIATPPSTHLDLTLAAIERGKHVIVEKPPFLRSADVDAVERAARARGVQVCVAENYVYKPLVASVRRVIDSGALGTVQFIQINALKAQRTGDWRDDRSIAGGGALFEGGIHWIAFMASLGMRIADVSAYRPGAQVGLERSILVVATYEGGAVGTLHYSWETPSPLKGLRWSRVFGSEGTATFESNGLFLSVSGKSPAFRIPGLKDIVGQRAMFADFLAAIRGARAPLYGLAEARRDLGLVEAAYGVGPRTRG